MHPGAQTSGHAPGHVWLTKNDTKEKSNSRLAHMTITFLFHREVIQCIYQKHISISIKLTAIATRFFFKTC